MLRKAILNGELKPGDRILETTVARNLQISRGPVREALANLKSEGLVRHEPYRGTFVSTLSRRDAREIYTLRALLEGEAAALAAARLTDDQVRRLESHLKTLAEAARQRDAEKIIHADTAFHRAALEASGHRRLTAVARDLDGLVGACYLTVITALPARLDAVIAIHELLIDALRSRNSDVARDAFSAHYLNSWNALAGVLED